jgi:hypothetical protein
VLPEERGGAAVRRGGGASPVYALTIDLPRQVVLRPDGTELPFEVAALSASTAWSTASTTSA